MAGRRTNLALFGLLALALATGSLAYAVGTEWSGWVVVAHGIVGFAIVLLSPWKSIVARRGLMRRRRGTFASVAFSFVIVLALIAGILHSTGAARSLAALTAMQLHVGAALVALPLALRHVFARPTRPRRMDLSRRNLLRSGMLFGAAGGMYVVTEKIMDVASLPGGDRRFTGSFERGSLAPEEMPVTQWLDDSVPRVDVASWRLVVESGGEPRAFTYDELVEYDDRVTATLDCTGGWYARQEWAGVWLDRLLSEADAASIAVSSVSGYGRRYPMSDSARLLLATRVGGSALSAGHGFPARIVAPGRRGFWWVKWVDRIEVSDRSWWLQSPFPLT